MVTPPTAFDQVLEAVQVDECVVVDRQPGDLLDRLGGRGDPGSLVTGVQAGVVVGPGVDPVEVAALAVEAVRELLVHRRAGGERHVGEVARQPEQDGATGLLVDAGDRDAVGTQALPLGSGVAAQQQDVVAAVLRLGHLVTAEDRLDEVALYGDEVAGEEQGTAEREAERAVERGHHQPVTAAHRQRLGDPPGVDHEVGPAEPVQDQPDAEQQQEARSHEQGDQLALPEQPEQHQHHDEQCAGHRAAHRDPADALVARDELSRARCDHGHRDQGQRAAQPDAGGGGGGIARAERTRRHGGKSRGHPPSITSHTRHTRHAAPMMVGPQRRSRAVRLNKPPGALESRATSTATRRSERLHEATRRTPRRSRRGGHIIPR